MSNSSRSSQEPFFVFEDSTAEEPIITQHGGRYYSPLPPPPPSTPQGDFSGISTGPYAFGLPHHRHESRMLSSNPALGPFPIPPPGCKACPKFFVYRPDGTPVPLIAIDELPSYMRLGWEDWQDPKWLRFMVPASLYPFPRTGAFEVYSVRKVDPINMYYSQPPDDMNYDLPDRGDCQSPQPNSDTSVRLSMEAMVLEDTEQSRSPPSLADNESTFTVVRREVTSCQKSEAITSHRPQPDAGSPEKETVDDDSSSNYSRQLSPFEPDFRGSTPTSSVSSDSFPIPQPVNLQATGSHRWDSRSVQDMRTNLPPLEMAHRRERSRSAHLF